MKKLFLLFSLLTFQLVVYLIFIQPLFLNWGTNEKEASMTLPGDNLAPFISSTRAINIDKSPTEVWKWVVQLGADRGGFYSYTFIEHLTGYDTDNTIHIIPQFQPMPVGRKIPSSRTNSVLNWEVLSVDPGKWFVLSNWGAFVLNPLDKNKTRFIVRTHGWELDTLVKKIGYQMIIPLHYLMERRMMFGIKNRAEAGEGMELPTHPDYLWFAGIVLSYIGIIVHLFIGQGVKKYLLSMVLSICWLFVLFVLDPHFIFSLLFLLLVGGSILFLINRSKLKSVS